MSDGLQNYIRDVLSELLERAREAKIKARIPAAAADGADRAFARGLAVAYYEVVSHLINQPGCFRP